MIFSGLLILIIIMGVLYSKTVVMFWGT